ncbi:MAG TPA: TauD/TfdA family dioxygenase, partial [Dongiaceae bacterium]
RLLTGLADYGFALLHKVLIEPGQVAAVGDRLGHVRVTNYGQLFDVVSMPNPNNLAFTAAGLSVHTDNPYRDPTPGLQLLHCLESDAPGGETMLVDGFRAAEELRRRHPEDFAVLARLPLSFHFADANADLKATTPVIATDFEGHVASVHFNNRSMSALDVPEAEILPWYRAYRRFAAILREPAGELRLRLSPGDLLIMENNRALHGRTAFDPNLGRRHLQGCYVDKDGVESRRRVLQRSVA